MNINRRTLFKIAGAVSAASVASAPRTAHASVKAHPDANAVLVDSTLCVGCRMCEASCSDANKLPEPERPGEDAIFEARRTPSPEHFTVVNRAAKKSPGGEERYAKQQCMHCIEPACATACAVNALVKTAKGPVTYEPSKCLGCRYCMVACPFSIPKYEYSKALPYVKKCTFCSERQEKGLPPACAENCGTGALTFGKRSELIEEAKKRIYQNPDKYIHEIYGEDEAGGTSWLYITDTPFSSYGFNTKVREESYPRLTDGIMSAVPFVLTLWPPLLAGIYNFTKKREEITGSEEHDEQ